MAHVPVLYEAVLSYLEPSPGDCFVDGTVGGGGHAAGLLEATAPNGRLLGLDRDPEALARASQRLAPFGDRALLVHDSFRDLRAVAHAYDFTRVDGVLLDLGLSSYQLEAAERGFSFLKNGPLDMRFDPTQGPSAADLVNQLTTKELADILYRFGEERQSRRIASAIAEARPIETTGALADVIARATGGRRGRLHPATRSFQALRIAVNDELGALEDVLPQAVDVLQPGGRVAVISFHSLEDRIVKHYFREQAQDCICPPRQPICTCDHEPTVRVITRKPVRPDEAEVTENPRSRSARLRVAERI